MNNYNKIYIKNEIGYIMNNLDETNKKTYDSISNNWDTKRQYYWEPVCNFLDSFNKRYQLKFLDIGCGGGRHMVLAFKKGFSKDKIWGCDFSKGQIETVLNKGFNAKVCDMRNLEFEDNMFDAIICIASFHHLLCFDDWIKALSEMKRILKKNGRILMSNWFCDKEFLEKQIEKGKFEFALGNEKIVRVKYTDKSQDKTFDRYYYLFDEKELITLCTGAGFSIESKKYDKGNLYLELGNN